MPSEFSNAGKASLRAIAVPPLVMNAVRARAQERRSRTGLRRIIVGATLAIGILGAATVAVVKNAGVDLWVSGNKGAFMMHSLEWIRSPQASEFRAAVANATFPVVYPVGLPAGAKLVDMQVAPQGAPSTVMLAYRGPGEFHADFILANPKIVNAAKFGPGGAQPHFGHIDTWRVGDEVVVVPKGLLSAAAIDRIESAMRKTSPAASAADAQSRLLPFIVLGGIDRVVTAARYAPSTGSSVLIEDSQVRSLPRRIAARDPFVDNRVQSLSGFIYEKGKLSGARSKPVPGVSSKKVVINLDGMKAIESALRAHGMLQCRCDVLFHRGAAAYTIWALPLGHGAVSKYVVPAT